MFYTSSTFVPVNENCLDDIQAELSAHDPGLEGAINIVAESEENFNMIMQAVGIDEIIHLESTGTVLIYESERVKGLFNKFREFFNKLYKKVKDLYYTFIALLDSWFKKDDAFVKKYREKLLGLRNLSKFKFKGYEFTLGNVKIKESDDKIDSYLKGIGLDSSKQGPHSNEADNKKNIEAIANWKDNTDKHLAKFRSIVVGEEKNYSSSDYTKALAKKLRNGKEEATEQSNVDPSNFIEIISAFKDAKKTATDDFKAIEKGINDAIKALNDAERKIVNNKDSDAQTIKNNSTATRFITTIVTAYKEKLNVLKLAQGAKMSALKQQNRQAKAVCVKLISYGFKNESVVEEGAIGSNLASVVLK